MPERTGFPFRHFTPIRLRSSLLANIVTSLNYFKGCPGNQILPFHNSLNVKHGPTGRRVAVSCLTFNELRKEWSRSAKGEKSPLALLSALKNHAIQTLKNYYDFNDIKQH